MRSVHLLCRLYKFLEQQKKYKLRVSISCKIDYTDNASFKVFICEGETVDYREYK